MRKRIPLGLRNLGDTSGSRVTRGVVPLLQGPDAIPSTGRGKAWASGPGLVRGKFTHPASRMGRSLEGPVRGKCHTHLNLPNAPQRPLSGVIRGRARGAPQTLAGSPRVRLSSMGIRGESPCTSPLTFPIGRTRPQCHGEGWANCPPFALGIVGRIRRVTLRARQSQAARPASYRRTVPARRFPDGRNVVYACHIAPSENAARLIPGATQRLILRGNSVVR